MPGKTKKGVRGDDFFLGRINGWVTVPYKSHLLLVDIQRQKRKDSHTHADNKEISRDTFREDPNIINPGDSSNYPTLDSDGEIEGGSVYHDNDDVDWVEPDPGSDDETMTRPTSSSTPH
ncbi:Hypothetical protein PHPALM_37252 [Phytophthora palmivora]|uniref:Uncharacterized protein n=1 Tax=Phytophthora palmivora TaxID=4796 RepID=A0A2P4WXW7_9STRA|nr:Hypothetical protein PHPALM_37252 [Phytophthora palmivora]